MAQSLTMTVMSGAQFALWAVVGLCFWKRKFSRRFPHTAKFLLLKLVSTPLLAFLAFETLSQVQGRHDLASIAYSILYWPVYLASAVLLLFICLEIFRSALAGYPVLMKYGIVLVRWIAVVSIPVSFASLPFVHRKLLLLSDVALGFMWAVSVVELCLLVFLVLGMNALRMTYRDFPFGLAIGFGLISIGDLITAAFRESAPVPGVPVLLGQGAFVLSAQILWILYCILPERETKTAPEPANSTVARWNEIASALGHNSARVHVQPRQSDGFFLSDVERVVDKVLSRNLNNNESGS